MGTAVVLLVVDVPGDAGSSGNVAQADAHAQTAMTTAN
jgi:hypothetical protein